MPGPWHDLTVEYDDETIMLRWRRDGNHRSGFNIEMTKLTYLEKKAAKVFRALAGKEADRTNKRYLALRRAVQIAANLPDG